MRHGFVVTARDRLRVGFPRNENDSTSYRIFPELVWRLVRNTVIQVDRSRAALHRAGGFSFEPTGFIEIDAVAFLVDRENDIRVLA